MIDFLIWIIVLAIVFGLILYVASLLALPPPFNVIIQVAVLLIFLLVLLSTVFGGGVHIRSLSTGR